MRWQRRQKKRDSERRRIKQHNKRGVQDTLRAILKRAKGGKR